MLFRSQRVWASLPVLIAVFLTRLDTIIFLALLLASLLFRWGWLAALTAVVLAAGLSVPLADAAGYIGWCRILVLNHRDGAQPHELRD
ncbi:hypothetical protein IVB30_31800 [Bradyrhizobium sp. 200]|uniref:hypothetical protein n=1 Tax=Bradyrhizobium sp. 200 TaxID=2782665 RepID=UPI0020004C7B|nr:hypothetical protein [Bradyrhizobium sp. 200]UPJ47775.1 hypothetical protein IVB30_31800 [Bradyrhizobium sp. 200]